MSTIRRRTVTTEDGVALHVVEAGDPAAQPLLLVHGFAGSSRVWDRQLADHELTTRYRVVAFDLRGHGSSQTDLDRRPARRRRHGRSRAAVEHRTSTPCGRACRHP